MRVFAFEGPYNLDAFESLDAAETYCEAIDVENGEYVFWGVDGTVITPSVNDGRVVLTPTSEKRPEELRESLRTWLVQLHRDESFADDAPAVAESLIEGAKAPAPRLFHRIMQFRSRLGTSRHSGDA